MCLPLGAYLQELTLRSLPLGTYPQEPTLPLGAFLQEERTLRSLPLGAYPQEPTLRSLPLGAYPQEPTLRSLPYPQLACKYQTRVEVTGNGKHSSLSQQIFKHGYRQFLLQSHQVLYSYTFHESYYFCTVLSQSVRHFQSLSLLFNLCGQSQVRAYPQIGVSQRAPIGLLWACLKVLDQGGSNLQWQTLQLNTAQN